MMRSVELGEFLRSRRERLDPTAVGFPPSPRRRAPGLRREELASLAGVAVSWLAKLEQGRAQGVSPEVLAALADALRLDDAERAHLFALAGLRPLDRPGAPSAASGSVGAPLVAVLTSLEPNPAYLLDPVWRIVAWNEAEAALFPPVAEGEEPRNLLELTFGDDALGELMADLDEEQVRLVSQLRVHATEWPSAELDEVVARLVERSPRFAQLWAGRDVAPFATTRRHFAHPLAGPLELDHHRLAVLDRPGWQLVAYTPVEGSDALERLAAVRA